MTPQNEAMMFLTARLDEFEAEGAGSQTMILRQVTAMRAILAEVEAIPHRYVEDCYYSCELAVDPDDPQRKPGSGYCNDNAVPAGDCTCGRDDLVARIRTAFAAIWSDHPDYRPEWAPG